MKRGISGIVSIFAVLSSLVFGMFPASAETAPKGPDNEVIELKSVFNQGASLNHTYYLNAFTLPADYVPKEGDALEYDVKTNVEAAGVGGLDVASVKDGDASFSPMRDTPNMADEDGTRTHPDADLSPFAYDQWYSRKMVFPDTFFGKTDGLKVMLCFEMTECKPYVGKEIYALFDNIRITRNGETLHMLFEDSSDSIVTDSFLMDMFSGNIFAQTTVKVIKESEAGPLITDDEESPTKPTDSKPATTPTKAASTTAKAADTSATSAQSDEVTGGLAWMWIIGAVVAAAAVAAAVVVILIRRRNVQK